MITKEQLEAKIANNLPLTEGEKIALSNIRRTNAAIEINPTADQVIIGSLLGDGSIVRKRTNCLFTINHSLLQKEYVLYKVSLLQEAGIHTKYLELQKSYGTARIEGRLIKDNGQARLMTEVNTAFNKYRDEWYNPKKEVPEAVYRLKALGLAIWYMDDGAIHYPTGLYLSTQGFNHASQLRLVDMLNKNFNVEAHIHKNKDKEILYIRERDKKKFLEIISPYVCSSMQYKIVGHNKQGELLET